MVSVLRVEMYHIQLEIQSLVGWGGVGVTPSLRVSRCAPRFCPPFSASGRSFCPPKFDHVYHFIQILLGPISKAPIFNMYTIFLPSKFDQIYHFIQILLGHFELRAAHPYWFLPGVPPPPPPPTPRGPARVSMSSSIKYSWIHFSV